MKPRASQSGDYIRKHPHRAVTPKSYTLSVQLNKDTWPIERAAWTHAWLNTGTLRKEESYLPLRSYHHPQPTYNFLLPSGLPTHTHTCTHMHTHKSSGEFNLKCCWQTKPLSSWQWLTEILSSGTSLQAKTIFIQSPCIDLSAVWWKTSFLAL